MTLCTKCRRPCGGTEFAEVDVQGKKVRVFCEYCWFKITREDDVRESPPEKEHTCDFQENGYCKICGESYNGH